MTKWKLFLDDERKTQDVFKDAHFIKDMILIRSVDEAKLWIKQLGCPYFISFDHDLGISEATGKLQPTGLDFAHWLIDSVLAGDFELPQGFRFNVHSANPPGARAIQGLMDCYLRVHYELCPHDVPEAYHCRLCEQNQEFPWDYRTGDTTK